jgi:hypothetical protein
LKWQFHVENEHYCRPLLKVVYSYGNRDTFLYCAMSAMHDCIVHILAINLTYVSQQGKDVVLSMYQYEIKNSYFRGAMKI